MSRWPDPENWSWTNQPGSGQLRHCYPRGVEIISARSTPLERCCECLRSQHVALDHLDTGQLSRRRIHHVDRSGGHTRSSPGWDRRSAARGRNSVSSVANALAPEVIASVSENAPSIRLIAGDYPPEGLSSRYPGRATRSSASSPPTRNSSSTTSSSRQS